ncbi:restriction endonuclease [Halalkalibacter krulwichiae]|uniref:restriction endonuclease n=1 Tax=Halalkalibacter krulwichiae TaxID=199441 RepID=UPI001F1E6E0D|nr:restriction endonuclease [Halalkalibacter krulwichiae]
MASRRRRTRRSKKTGYSTIGAFLFVGIIYLKTLIDSNPGAATAVLLILLASPFLYFAIKKSIIYRNYRNVDIAKVDKMTGLEFEEYLAPLFEIHGYSAKVTQGSGDYGADLVVSKKGVKTVVQAKRYSSNIGVSAVQEIAAAKPFYHARKAMVVTNQYFTKQAKSLARANGVTLVDRDSLMAMINGAYRYERNTALIDRVKALISFRRTEGE